jgi:hypothetical protein
MQLVRYDELNVMTLWCASSSIVVRLCLPVYVASHKIYRS